MQTLKHPQYLKLQGTVGGNQRWLHAGNRRLARAGCGLVAFADFAFYRAQHYPAEQSPCTAQHANARTPQQYACYLRHFARQHCPVHLPNGMSGWQLAFHMQQYYQRYIPSRHVCWRMACMSADPLAQFRAHLAQDFPVILSLPPYFGGAPLQLYTAPTCKTGIPYRMHGGHFVTLIGILARQNRPVLLQIVSWGQVFYVEYAQYLRVVHAPAGWLGSGWIALL